MNGTSKKLVGVYKAYTPTNSIYNGDVLVWGSNKKPILTGLAGKFLDTSTENNWWYYANGAANTNNKTLIDVDTNSKEFSTDMELVGNCGYMFYFNSALERIDNIPITSKVTNIMNMFGWCEKLTSINASNWDLSQVTLMNNLFNNCSSLTEIDVRNWVFPNVKLLVGIFSECTKLQNIDVSNWDTSNITSIGDLFHNCKSLKEIDISSWDKSNITIVNSLFYGCESLETLNLGNWDWNNITAASYPFALCSKLKYVNGTLSGIKQDLLLNVSPLTNESAMRFINGLAEVSETKTITFKKTTYNTLTDEQKAIATSKGWTIKSA